MRRQPKEGMGKSVHRLGLLRRCMHWCNFHAPLVISLLWIPPLSSGLLPWVGTHALWHPRTHQLMPLLL
jgi:hypothetical protein